MASTISAVRDALQDYLNNAVGLLAYDVWSEQFEAPAVMIKPRDGEYDQQFGDSTITQYTFTAQVFVSLAAGLRVAQDTLDPYITPTGTKSVRAVIDADPTLGGLVMQAVVLGYHNYEVVRYPADGGPEWLSVVFDVDVWAE